LSDLANVEMREIRALHGGDFLYQYVLSRSLVGIGFDATAAIVSDGHLLHGNRNTRARSA
jgi:hypothetical protein